MKKGQIPITNVLDEIYDPDMTAKQKEELKAEYEKFFASLSHEDRVELTRYLVDDQVSQV